MDWQPTEFDINWTQNLIHSLKDGGVWGFQSSSVVLRIDKINKKLILIVGDKDNLAVQRLGIVLDKMGWTLETQDDVCWN